MDLGRKVTKKTGAGFGGWDYYTYIFGGFVTWVGWPIPNHINSTPIFQSNMFLLAPFSPLALEVTGTRILDSKKKSHGN